MNIVLHGRLPSETALRVCAAVRRVIGDRPDLRLRVWVARPSRSNWSVFISGLAEHPMPLVEKVRAALSEIDRENVSVLTKRPAHEVDVRS